MVLCLDMGEQDSAASPSLHALTSPRLCVIPTVSCYGGMSVWYDMEDAACKEFVKQALGFGREPEETMSN